MSNNMGYDRVKTLSDQIQKIKKEKDTVILAHYYEEGPIQDIADFVGDSFYLAKKGQEIKANSILLAGVVFMAESVKILNPDKIVLVPDLEASCSLVKGSPYKEYLRWRQKFNTGIAVTYINSSAEVKAISDVIVTSSNAEKIIHQIPPNRPILFGPDQHLGRWLSKKLKREMIFWPGSCEVHVLFNARKLFDLICDNPDAVVIAHPECDETVLQYANVIGSTSKLLEEVEKNPANKFIVATETGIFHQMQKIRPDVKLIQAPVLDSGCSCNDCPYMKLNSLEKILKAIETQQPQVSMNEQLRKRAQVPLDRMLNIASGQSVIWPDVFELGV